MESNASVLSCEGRVQVDSYDSNDRIISLYFDSYKEVRREIHYEYTLMANRINWLLASQTFLFTALAIAIPKDQGFVDISQSGFSKIAPVIGMCSTWLISSAIVANILRIWDWKRIQRDKLESIKSVVPKFPRDSLPGFGLLPPVGLPMLFFGLWSFILFHQIDWFWNSSLMLAGVSSVTAIVSVWSSAFYFYCMDEDVSARIFKVPISIIKKYRVFFFSVSVVLLLLLFAYVIQMK